MDVGWDRSQAAGGFGGGTAGCGRRRQCGLDSLSFRQSSLRPGSLKLVIFKGAKVSCLGLETKCPLKKTCQRGLGSAGWDWDGDSGSSSDEGGHVWR